MPFLAAPMRRLTVEQYAELHVALHARPAPSSDEGSATLARFGLDGWGTFRDVALSFRSRFVVDVALREQWLTRVAELRLATSDEAGSSGAGAGR